MEGNLPFIIFKTKKGKFAIDAYLITRVEKIERIAVLIRKADNMSEIPEIPENLTINTKNFEEFIEYAMEKIRRKSGKTMNSRLRKMRRWNIFRFLGIPTGHSRHISEEERLAKENREALLALGIMENVFRGELEVLGFGIAKVELREGRVFLNGAFDPVYTELIKTDMRAAMGLLEILR
ncbi:hypothetical protein [Pyrococcus sp. ST04]|uniref:hypothetical protein n=1 Tax=Pyrococcus sp. ST04 TaxID=1183377 RepID=UPI0002605DF5|nr:hypothetical protein [Pyrococcus sp. ST04]AFK22527.1 hypothetical protein Py04_0945 [Pyrococcus sp. ST04]